MTFFDTAEIYGPFANERLLAEAIRGKREGLVIATKFAMNWDGETIAGTRRQPGQRPPRLRRLAQAAGRRHDRPVLPAPRRSATCRSRRRSAAWPAGHRGQGAPHRPLRSRRLRRIRRAATVHPIAALQSEYSLWERDVEDAILPALPRAWHRLRALQPARARLPDRRIPQPATTFPPTIGGAMIRAGRRRTWPPTSRSSTPSPRSRTGTASPTRRSPWPGCSPRVTTSCRSPGVERRVTLEDSAAAVDVQLSAEDLAALRRSCAVSRSPALRARWACGWCGC